MGIGAALPPLTNHQDRTQEGEEMKNRKRNASEKIVDFTEIKLKKEKDDINQKLYGMAELGDYEFKIAMVDTLKNSWAVTRTRNQNIDKGFEIVAKHLKAIYSELKFLNQMLFMETLFSQEHRDGSMTIEQKSALAGAFKIDFKKFIAQVLRREKR